MPMAAHQLRLDPSRWWKRIQLRLVVRLHTGINDLDRQKARMLFHRRPIGREARLTQRAPSGEADDPCPGEVVVRDPRHPLWERDFVVQRRLACRAGNVLPSFEDAHGGDRTLLIPEPAGGPHPDGSVRDQAERPGAGAGPPRVRRRRARPAARPGRPGLDGSLRAAPWRSGPGATSTPCSPPSWPLTPLVAARGARRPGAAAGVWVQAFTSTRRPGERRPRTAPRCAGGGGRGAPALAPHGGLPLRPGRALRRGARDDRLDRVRGPPHGDLRRRAAAPDPPCHDALWTRRGPCRPCSRPCGAGREGSPAKPSPRPCRPPRRRPARSQPPRSRAQLGRAPRCGVGG